MKNIKLLGSEAACGTSSGNGSNFGNSRLVRLVNDSTTNRLVTLETSANSTIGTLLNVLLKKAESQAKQASNVTSDKSLQAAS